MQRYNKKDGKIEISCKVKNTGTVFGKETVQVYLAPKDRRKKSASSGTEGFEKVTLEAGEQTEVVILATGSVNEYEIRIGSSSRDIRLTM